MFGSGGALWHFAGSVRPSSLALFLSADRSGGQTRQRPQSKRTNKWNHSGPGMAQFYGAARPLFYAIVTTPLEAAAKVHQDTSPNGCTRQWPRTRQGLAMGLSLISRERIIVMIVQFRTKQNRERRLRRSLVAEGFRLWKVRENSRYYWEYGPYSVLDRSTSMVMVSGVDLGQVENWFNG